MAFGDYDGRAIEVFENMGSFRDFGARCNQGHVWVVTDATIELIREKLSLVSWDHKATRWLRDMPHVLECPECLTAARLAVAAVFDDPDYLRIPGHAE